MARSVIRPLADAVGETAPDPAAADPAGEAAGDEDAAELLWRLARDATELRAAHGLPTQLQEATAALQDLATRGAPERIAELRELMAPAPTQIQSQHERAVPRHQRPRLDRTGSAKSSRPARRWRCAGAAQSADQADLRRRHAAIGFTDAKDPDRVPTGATPTTGCRSRSTTTAESASTRGSAPTGCRRVFHTEGRSSRRAADGWTRSSAPSATARRARSATRSTGSRPASEVDWDGEREPAIEISQGRPVPDHRRHPAERRATASRRARAGLLARALRAVPVRALAEQAVLQRHALVRRLQGSRARPRPRADAVRVVRRTPRAHADDAHLLREARPRGSAARAAVRQHVAGPSASASRAGSARCSAARSSTARRYGGYQRMVSQHLGKALTEEMRARWVS